MPRRWPIGAVPVVGVAAALAGVLAHGGSTHAAARSSDSATATSLATVVRRSSLAETTPVGGTLGYAAGYSVLGQLTGRITALPAVGRVIRDGRALYRVDDAPVVLLRGSVPAYRALTEGAIGADVRQLNRSLVDLGYASRADLDPSSDEFGWATRAAVDRLQAHLGVPQTGALALGQVVFLPTAARVTSVHATLGGPATGAVLSASSTTREVSVNLDAGLQSQVRRGDKVTITLPDGTTTPGRVFSVRHSGHRRGRRLAGDGPAADRPDAARRHPSPGPGPRGGGDRRSHRARRAGGAGERADGARRRPLRRRGRRSARHEAPGAREPGPLRRRRGLVQVSGPGLAAGQRVVVPAA
jgi:hypothetical protein